MVGAPCTVIQAVRRAASFKGTLCELVLAGEGTLGLAAFHAIWKSTIYDYVLRHINENILDSTFQNVIMALLYWVYTDDCLPAPMTAWKAMWCCCVNAQDHEEIRALWDSDDVE